MAAPECRGHARHHKQWIARSLTKCAYPVWNHISACSPGFSAALPHSLLTDQPLHFAPLLEEHHLGTISHYQMIPTWVLMLPGELPLRLKERVHLSSSICISSCDAALQAPGERCNRSFPESSLQQKGQAVIFSQDYLKTRRNRHPFSQLTLSWRNALQKRSSNIRASRLIPVQQRSQTWARHSLQGCHDDNACPLRPAGRPALAPGQQHCPPVSCCLFGEQQGPPRSADPDCAAPCGCARPQQQLTTHSLTPPCLSPT